MVTKAFIQEVINPHTVKIRMPLFNKLEDVDGSTPTSELAVAPICTVANITNDPHPGDIVFVSFEEDDLSKPVVIGYLSLHNMGISLPSIKCENLEAQGEINLNKDTTIGEIYYENIFQLKNLNENIVEKFKSIDKLIEDINTEINELKQKDTNIENIIGKQSDTESDTLWGNININASDIDTLDETIGDRTNIPATLNNQSTIWDNINHTKNNYLNKNNPRLMGGYGPSLPTSGMKEGDLYFIPLDKVNFNNTL